MLPDKKCILTSRCLGGVVLTHLSPFSKSFWKLAVNTLTAHQPQSKAQRSAPSNTPGIYIDKHATINNLSAHNDVSITFKLLVFASVSGDIFQSQAAVVPPSLSHQLASHGMPQESERSAFKAASLRSSQYMDLKWSQYSHCHSAFKIKQWTAVSLRWANEPQTCTSGPWHGVPKHWLALQMPPVERMAPRNNTVACPFQVSCVVQSTWHKTLWADQAKLVKVINNQSTCANFAQTPYDTIGAWDIQ